MSLEPSTVSPAEPLTEPLVEPLMVALASCIALIPLNLVKEGWKPRRHRREAVKGIRAFETEGLPIKGRGVQCGGANRL